MADSDNKYLWQLTASSSISDSDALYVARDIGGTPTHNYILYSDVFAGAGINITSTDVGIQTSLDGLGNPLFNFAGKLNAQTATTYEVVSSDNGLIITLNNPAAITVTIDENLTAGFNCSLIQKGAGKVGVVAEGSGNIRNFDGHAYLAGQYAVGTIFVESNAGTAPEIYFQGRTASS